MKRFAILFFVVLLLSSTAQEKPFDLYLLIGQSNMAGRGKVESQDSVVHPRVFTLDKTNRWVPAQDPIHFDKAAAGVGLGRTFGIEMATVNPDAIIGLIPCAVGGSPIDAWVPGGFHDQTNSYPFDDMEKRLKVALGNGTLKGILWHQGESDANPEKCNEYREKLELLVKRVRAIAQNENAPFVAGELGRFKQKSNKKQYPDLKVSPAEAVIIATREVIKNDGNAAFVKTNGLTHLGDNTHFNAESYRILGKRYARKMIQLQKK